MFRHVSWLHKCTRSAIGCWGFTFAPRAFDGEEVNGWLVASGFSVDWRRYRNGFWLETRHDRIVSHARKEHSSTGSAPQRFYHPMNMLGTDAAAPADDCRARLHP